MTARAGIVLLLVVALAATAAGQPEVVPPPRPVVEPLPEGAVARVGRPRLRMPGAAINVAFAPTGTTFISTSNPPANGQSTDRLAVLWDAATGRELREFRGHTGGVEAVAFTPDGKRIVTGSLDRTLRVWDVPTGASLAELTGHTGPILAVAFAADSKRVASLSQDGTAKLWDVDTRKPVYSWPAARSRGTSNLRFSPDGEYLAGVGPDFGVRLWGTRDGAEARKLTGPTSDVLSLDFAPDGSRLAAAGGGGRVWVWNPETGAEVLCADVHTALATCVRYSPDGATLAVGGNDGSLAFCDAATGKRRQTLAGHPRNLSELSYSADGTVLATAGHEGTIRLWDVATGQPLPQSGGQATRAALSPDGKRLATTGDNATVQFWNLVTGAELLPAVALTQPATAIAFTPTGDLITTDALGDVRHWAPDGTPRRPVRTDPGVAPPRPNRPFSLLAVGPGGRFVAAVGAGVAELLPAVGDRPPPEAAAFRQGVARFGAIRALALSPGDRYAAVAGTDGRLHVWNLASGTEAFAVSPADTAFAPFGVAWSPDGRSVVAVAGTVRVWEVASGRERRAALALPGAGWAVAVSPDGALVAVGGQGYLRVCDARTGQELVTRAAHVGPVTYLAFTPDGRHLVTASADQTLLAGNGTSTVLSGDGTAVTWDVAALAKGRPAVPPATAADLDALWAALGGPDAVKADDAIWRLAAAPAVAVPFLRERLPKVAVMPSDGRVGELIAALDHDDFDAREKATAELIRLGPPGGAAARRALAETTSREVRRRAEEIVSRVGTGSGKTAEEVLIVRGVEVLQRVGTTEARRLLEAWAKGASGGVLREAALATGARAEGSR